MNRSILKSMAGGFFIGWGIAATNINEAAITITLGVALIGWGVHSFIKEMRDA